MPEYQEQFLGFLVEVYWNSMVDMVVTSKLNNQNNVFFNNNWNIKLSEVK